jgi:hypothetical protein
LIIIYDYLHTLIPLAKHPNHSRYRASAPLTAHLLFQKCVPLEIVSVFSPLF